MQTTPATTKDASATDEKTPKSGRRSNHFVGRGNLRAAKDAPHDKVMEVTDRCRANKGTRQKAIETFDRDNVGFYARFNAYGASRHDTCVEDVTFA